MYWAEILVIACGLSMDAFAVSLGAAASGRTQGFRAAFRLSFHFGLFQFLMPVIGWFLAFKIGSYFTGLDHWIAFGLLLIVGGRMILSGLSANDESAPTDPSRGLSLLALSVATSIDALAIGITLAMLRTGILWPSVVIGITTCGLSLVGIAMGTSLGLKFGKKMEIAGGVLLAAIGLQIVYSHLVQ